jgi:predicted amidohydrolase
MRIATAAYPIDWHNRWNDYVGKLRVWVRTAAEQGAQLLVFPEYAALELASLAGEDNAKDPQRAVDAVNARIKDVDDLHASLAREFKVHIAAATGPVRRRGDGRPVNRARLFAPDGSQGRQDKLIPTEFEREVWAIAPGDAVRVFETDLGRIGILIGYDAEFPLAARAMAEAGAEILLVPSAAATPRGHARLRTSGLARALENQCVVVHAMTVGDADWLPVARKSVGVGAIYGPADVGFPEDGVIAIGKLNSAGWVHGEITLEQVRHVRSEGHVRGLADWAPPPGEVETVRLGADEPAPAADPTVE